MNKDDIARVIVGRIDGKDSAAISRQYQLDLQSVSQILDLFGRLFSDKTEFIESEIEYLKEFKSYLAVSTKIGMPDNVSLPFFSYGLFQPGSLGFLRIKEFVNHVDSDVTVIGNLTIRDGLPLFSIGNKKQIRVTGTLVHFKADKEKEAYESIRELEPQNLYQWKSVNSYSSDQRMEQSVNILEGKKPKRGAEELKDRWVPQDDPLFSEALNLVEQIKEEIGFDIRDDKKTRWQIFFRAQMAYLLLFSIIERYASLRYNLEKKASFKVYRIGEEQAFQTALQEECLKGSVKDRSICSKLDPSDLYKLQKLKIRDNQSDIKIESRKAIRYYYQVRNNIVHRGKAGYIYEKDFEHVGKSLGELTNIFKKVLNQAFEDAKWN